MGEIRIGGQAVYEGVMIRAGDKYAVAVRASDGSIRTKLEHITPLTKRYPFLRYPILRGIAGFIETLSVGLATLNWSVEQFEPSGKSSPIASALNYILAFAIAIALFMGLPLGLSQALGLKNQPLLFNISAGIIRVLVFFLYIYIIGRSKEIRKYFQYHGAEHKSIITYEQGKPLTVENILPESPFHPRCGTSFIFLTIIFAILFFSIVDGLYGAVKGYAPALHIRLALHLIFLPVMLGASWEILRKSGELYGKTRWVSVVIYPGLIFQRLTALEPSREQIEVAIAAIKLATQNENA